MIIMVDKADHTVQNEQSKALNGGQAMALKDDTQAILNQAKEIERIRREIEQPEERNLYTVITQLQLEVGRLSAELDRSEELYNGVCDENAALEREIEELRPLAEAEIERQDYEERRAESAWLDRNR
jgi:hypothetical protein